MKALFFFLFSFLLVSIAQAQGVQATTKPEEGLQFKEMEHNFGKIPQGKPVYYTFEVTNKSSQPLKLDNVQASCGCTTPEWSREEIAPGATAKIKVGYNAAAAGAFDKTITVFYNNQTETKVLRIKGEVWKAPEGAAPANAPVQLLKEKLN